MTAQRGSSRGVLLAALLLLAASAQQAAAQQGRGIFKPMIVLVGDSITEVRRPASTSPSARAA